MEKVSVIVPTFNRFKYLLNTISSIKQQTYTNLEIIVVNDCSNDKFESFQTKWMKVFLDHHEQGGLVNPNREEERVLQIDQER